MKKNAIVVLVTSSFFALFADFFFRWAEIPQPLVLSLFAGFLFALLLLCILIYHQKQLKKRYAQLEETISSPILFKENGNFNTGAGGIKNGTIYFCEAGILCACLSDKPYSLDEIPRGSIDHYFFDDIQLVIVTKDDRTFFITMPRVRELKKILEDKGRIQPCR